MSREAPPKSDEFEISVIGPGRGECVIVHLGNNDWFVVDSCAAPGAREPVAVEYLSSFRNDALAGVRLLLATHWHDDHIRGIASALRSFPNADFSCSSALQKEQFITLVQLQSQAIQGDSGVDEFAQIYSVLLERRANQRGRNLVTPRWAIQDRLLMQFGIAPHSIRSRVTALSPSDGTVKLALNQIASLIPQPGEVQRRLPDLTPNASSVVIWIEAGGRRALLGADLEHSQRSEEGWFAVLDSECEKNKAFYIKVPHHGSPNADAPEVWSQLLESNPIAVVTPFTSGRALPQPGDIARLKTRTEELYCTATPKKTPKRDSVVEKLLKQAKPRRTVDGRPGHVRMRVSLTDAEATPSIELFHGAFKA